MIEFKFIKLNKLVINSDDLLFCFRLKPYVTIMGFVLAHYIFIWRGQFTAKCKEYGFKETGIQSLETAKIQSKLLNTKYPLKPLMALIAVKNTLLLTATEYVKAPNKGEFLDDQILQAMEYGEAKILAKEQIRTPEDLAITRRGIMARQRGNIKAEPIFRSNQIISGKNIIALTFSEFIQLMAKLLVSLLSVSLKNLIEIIWDNELMEGTLNTLVKKSEKEWDKVDTKDEILFEILEKIIERAIFIYLFEGKKVEISDGIDFSTNNNLIPMEEMSNTCITRYKSRILSSLEIDSNSEDPILREIALQQSRLIEPTKNTSAKKSQLRRNIK